MINQFFTSQQEVCNNVINKINSFNRGDITEEELSKYIYDIFEINRDVIYKEGEIGSIIKQRLGKKRIRLIRSIIKDKEGC